MHTKPTHMTKKTFPDGSFAIHGIAHLSTRRISAWFDPKGKPVSAEYMTTNSARQVSRRHHSVWLSLESIGRAWLV